MLPLQSTPVSEDGAEAEQAASRAQAREIVLEVRDLVLDHYLDARQSGFDKDKWRGMVSEVLSGPLPDTAAAHRWIYATYLVHLHLPHIEGTPEIRLLRPGLGRRISLPSASDMTAQAARRHCPML